MLLANAVLFALRDKAFLNKLASGRASSRFTNLLCCMPVLLYNSYRIYLRPCIASYVASLLHGMLCAPLRMICVGPLKCFCVHTDKKWRGKAAIGEWEGKSFSDDEVVWVRASDLLLGGGGGEAKQEAAAPEAGGRRQRLPSCTAQARVKLFEGSIDPHDLAQGSVGDCWLIAAFACAAEHPGLIQRVFVTKRATASGKYRIRLYDWQQKRFVTLTIDDYLPTKGGTTALFAQPQGREIWVALLEKAFAKFCGSYGALDGGSTAWGLNALTGDPAFELRKGDDGSWSRIDIVAQPDEANKRKIALYGKNPPETYTSDELFFIIRKYAQQGALMGASFGSYGGGGGEGLNGEDMGPQGLVSGHAYSVLDAKRFHTKEDGQPLCLVQFRNPWGKGEWEGAWSDKSEEWSKHPAVRRICRPKDADDGAFWMSWKDASKIFSSFDVCARSVGVQDLQLDLKEADGCLKNCIGPLKGCCAGCCVFWCFCAGCRALYGPEGGSDVTISIDGDEKGAFDDKMGTRVGQLLEDTAATVQAI